MVEVENRVVIVIVPCVRWLLSWNSPAHRLPKKTLLYKTRIWETRAKLCLCFQRPHVIRHFIILFWKYLVFFLMSVRLSHIIRVCARWESKGMKIVFETLSKVLKFTRVLSILKNYVTTILVDHLSLFPPICHSLLRHLRCLYCPNHGTSAQPSSTYVNGQNHDSLEFRNLFLSEPSFSYSKSHYGVFFSLALIGNSQMDSRADIVILQGLHLTTTSS